MIACVTLFAVIVAAAPPLSVFDASVSMHEKVHVSHLDVLFAGKCKAVHLEAFTSTTPSTLHGECTDDQGTLWNTSIDMNECIGSSDNGTLIYQHG